MNIFVIPSWYPNAVQPLSGVFVREQAEALAEFSPSTRVIVSTWGHEAAEFSMRRAGNAIGALKNWFFHFDKVLSIQNGVHQIMSPALLWSPRLPFGGLQRLLAVNRKNLVLAIGTFGSVNVIHAHVSYPAGFIAAKLSEQFGIPYVLTEHMSPFPFESLKDGGQPIAEIREAFQSAKATVAVSTSLAERISSFGYRRPYVIGNCVNEQRFSPGVPAGKKIIFFTLCAMSEQKGIDQLLEAIALWNPSKELFEFRIAGDGAMLVDLKRLAYRLGLLDRIVWLGVVTPYAAPQLYRDCHIFVLPSKHETFGVVFAEAIATGKPIIATRCGGPEDIVNATNGVLVEVGDINGLSDAMQTMAKNWDLYDPEAIREDFEKRFSRKIIASQLLTIYNQVLQDY